MNKLTKEELSQLQNLVADYNVLKMQIGDTVITQNNLISKADEFKKVFNENESVLMSKYGANSHIDINTGEISYPEAGQK